MLTVKTEAMILNDNLSFPLLELDKTYPLAFQSQFCTRSSGTESHLPQSSHSKPPAPAELTHAEFIIKTDFFLVSAVKMFNQHSRKTPIPAFKNAAAAVHS